MSWKQCEKCKGTSTVMVEIPEGSGFTFPVQCDCENGQVHYNLPPSIKENYNRPRMYDDDDYARPNYNCSYNYSYGSSPIERKIINEFLDEYGDDPGVSHAVENIMRDADRRTDLADDYDRQEYITHHLLRLRDSVGSKRRRDSYGNNHRHREIARRFIGEYGDDPEVKNAIQIIFNEARRIEKESPGIDTNGFIEREILKLRERMLETNYIKSNETW